ncbi:hypothetical protein H5410_014491 [Solanum commersonii]|uniref:Uncharacterized protein n=1 Tax=Solanum commersonii TaxID=4109 RepID=A0A9J5ZRE1_SOLCO|nr:hypothetical protein H5410_014491 [Solanum commersonii]
MRRPTRVVISDEPSRVNISKRASVQLLTRHTSHIMPLLLWLHNLGYSHLGRGSTIPSTSASKCNSLNTSSGSIGLFNLHLESNGSEPNTPTT